MIYIRSFLSSSLSEAFQKQRIAKTAQVRSAGTAISKPTPSIILIQAPPHRTQKQTPPILFIIGMLLCVFIFGNKIIPIAKCDGARQNHRNNPMNRVIMNSFQTKKRCKESITPSNKKFYHKSNPPTIASIKKTRSRNYSGKSYGNRPRDSAS